MYPVAPACCIIVLSFHNVSFPVNRLGRPFACFLAIKTVNWLPTEQSRSYLTLTKTGSCSVTTSREGRHR